MKKVSLLVLFLVPLLSSVSSRERDPHILKLEIYKSFQANKKIWGTYKQVAETFILSNGKKKFIEKTKRQTGDLILGKKNLVLVRHVTSKLKNKKQLRQSKINVKSFGYEKKGKSLYMVDLKAEKNKDLLDLYGQKIQSILNRKRRHIKGKITNGEFRNIVCKRKKSRLNCILPIYFKLNQNKNTSR